MPQLARIRTVGLLGVVALVLGGTAHAQVATGEIDGTVRDTTGGVLPGTTVTVSSPVLLQPLRVVTTAGGTYRFPLLPPGTYQARFELAGFRALVRDGVRVEIGLHARVDVALTVGGRDEVVQVQEGVPLVDVRDAGRSSRFTREVLQEIPSARDPWAIIEQSAGVVMDRQNVGGSTSGQQGNHVALGTARESRWSLDGVDITDMTATGSSPFYYDFDAFEEIQVTIGGADVTMQAAGLAIDLVTRSGTDRFRGGGRYYLTHEALQSNNVTDEIRRQGAFTGNPIQSIEEYGLEAGGPLVKGRAWMWGGYGTQRIGVGVNGFYRGDARCQAVKADPLGHSLDENQACLETDWTFLETYTLKLSLQTTRRNQFSFFLSAADKVRPTRDASDLRPLETTVRQGGVTRSDLGSRWWTTGVPRIYKWSDRHVFGDRFMVEGVYAHVGANFATTFHDESLRHTQPALELSTNSWSRSYGEDVNIRPADIVQATGVLLLSGWFGDHQVSFGFTDRRNRSHYESQYGGDAVAVFQNGNPNHVRLYRRSYTDGVLQNRSVYVQDSYARRRLTINAGFRFDHQRDHVNPASVPANPFFGQPTLTGALFDQLPAIDFPGARPAVSFNTVSPRVSASLDLTGSGRMVLKGSFARYVGQLGGSTSVANVYNPAALATVWYPWVDLNGDRYVQANEIRLLAAPTFSSPGYDYRNPGKTTTSGTVDPNLSVDHTHEAIVSLEQVLAAELVVGVSYIWRRYGNARWNDIAGWTSANYTPVTWQPTGCPPDARCRTVTYYNPTGRIPTEYVLTNQPGYRRSYQGLELTARKRLARGWMLSASLSYNDARAHYDSASAYEDPTNVENLGNAQYAPAYTVQPGLPEVYLNARWIFRVSGSYRTPVLGLDVAGFFDSRGGYPFVASIETPIRDHGAGKTRVYLDRLGDTRLPAVRTVDVRVGRPFGLGRLRLAPTLDVFNLLNANTPLSIHPVQNAITANRVSTMLSPRVVRIGVRVEW